MVTEKANDYQHFFYNAGLQIGRYFGGKSNAFKHRTISAFMEFVSLNGGVDGFKSSKEAVEHFIRKTKGGTRAYKH